MVDMPLHLSPPTILFSSITAAASVTIHRSQSIHIHSNTHDGTFAGKQHPPVVAVASPINCSRPPQKPSSSGPLMSQRRSRSGSLSRLNVN